MVKHSTDVLHEQIPLKWVKEIRKWGIKTEWVIEWKTTGYLQKEKEMERVIVPGQG